MERRKEGMDAEKHIKKKERLDQALNGELSAFVEAIKELLKTYNLDLTPGIALDAFTYTLEELHLEKLNVPEWKL